MQVEIDNCRISCGACAKPSAYNRLRVGLIMRLLSFVSVCVALAGCAKQEPVVAVAPPPQVVVVEKPVIVEKRVIVERKVPVYVPAPKARAPAAQPPAKPEPSRPVVVTAPPAPRPQVVVVERPVLIERQEPIYLPAPKPVQQEPVVVIGPGQSVPPQPQPRPMAEVIVKVPKGATPPIIPEPPAPKPTSVPIVRPRDVKSSGPVNINTASQAELEKLPGIGKKRAAAIVAARSSRRFSSLDDMAARGVIPKTLPEKLKGRAAP